MHPLFQVRSHLSTHPSTQNKSGAIARILFLVTATAFQLANAATIPHEPTDSLQPIPSGRVKLGGFLGNKIDLCIRNRIATQEEDYLVAPFRERKETSLWQTEFWGKWITSAIAAYRYQPSPSLRSTIDAAVSGLLTTQSADGYIGNYADSAHLHQWDVWGRKYSLLGLLAYYDLTGDKPTLRGASRLADHLLTEVGPGKANIVETGNYRGMPSSSVLEPMVLLYRRTDQSRYLDFAKYIVTQWETDQGPKLISKAVADVPVAERFPHPKVWWGWENGEKAYEMMSCYEGLLELYRITGESRYLAAVEKAVNSILESEINIAGSGSAFECWYHGRERQTQPTYHMMETCVTQTWMKLCLNLLKLTGESRYADQIEWSAYNALLGSMTPDGTSFAKYSPLEGSRSLGEDQCGMNLNCCIANGPRALMLLPGFAVLQGKRKFYINLYAPFKASLPVSRSNEVILEQSTTYPVDDRVEIRVTPKKPLVFTIALRIPAWSEQSSLMVNDQPVEAVKAGSYATITRRWLAGDKILLTLDLRGRVVNQGNFSAIVRGPVVLARDSRLGSGFVDEAGVPQQKDGYLPLVMNKEAGSEQVWMSFSAPFRMGTNLEGHQEPVMLPLCDFASGGNGWNLRDRYRVWIPKPVNVMNSSYKPY